MTILHVLVSYLLLQPLAHWLIQLLHLSWWTWTGLLALAAIVALNSAVVTALLAFVSRARWPRR